MTAYYPFEVSVLEFTLARDVRGLILAARDEGRTHFHVVASENPAHRRAEGVAVRRAARTGGLLVQYLPKKTAWLVQL